VLFSDPIGLEDLQSLLRDCPISRRIPQGSHWALAGPTLIIDYLPGVNGRVSLDIVPCPWPDAVDPDPQVFTAWTMGCFGPFAYPENLSRALQHSAGFPEAAGMVERHRCFVRLRSSYLFGAAAGTPALPAAYDPAAELTFLTSLSLRLLEHPAALCYFNPNGEVLFPAHQMREIEAHYAGRKLPLLELWTQVRTFPIQEGWVLMDTVGMQQLDREDLEVVFDCNRFEPQEMSRFLRNVALFTSSRGPIVRPGHGLDGPAHTVFVAQPPQPSLLDPPRTTMRFLAQGSAPPRFP
jgi:hypothetical protein